MQDSAPSRTAEFVCLFRALEGRRAQRIVEDPFAQLFLGRSMTAALRAAEAAGPLGDIPARLMPGVGTYVLARHRFIDDALAAALARTGADRVEQVVVLGAGYDTRAQRFAAALAGRPVFEIDFPSTSRRKGDLSLKHQHKLPPSVVRRVEVDFLNETFDGPLLHAGFQKGARTFVIWEGVSMYLTRAAVKQTLAMLRALCALRSELVMDFWYLLDAPDLRAAAHRLSANLLHWLGEPVLFGVHPEDAPAFFSAQSYGVTDVADAATLAARYVSDGRSVYPAMFCLHATMA